MNKRFLNVAKQLKPVLYHTSVDKSFNDELKSVITVKQQGQTLMAIVEKMDECGNINKVSIPTEELRKINPWILINFYESKIKFT